MTGDATRRRGGERGALAGAESLALATLVLLGGSLLVANAWAVLDTRLALDSAAREYLRAYTEAVDPMTARSAGRRALGSALADRPRLGSSLAVTDPDADAFGPCAPARVELRAEVPSLPMPFLEGFGRHTVVVDHVELVDAHRELDAVGDAHRIAATPCGG